VSPGETHGKLMATFSKAIPFGAFQFPFTENKNDLF